MTKTFATLTALGALMMTPALAQAPAPQPASPPAMQAPATSPSAMQAPTRPATPPSHAQSTTSSPSQTTGMASATEPASAKPSPVDAQSPDEFLASSFKGTDVIGADGKKVGDVNDILFEKDGSIKAYVVGVGGFLGIGSKSVAFSPKSFEVVPGKSPSDTKLKLAMNQDELKAAATFKPYKAPASTTGMSTTGMSTHPVGGGHPAH